MRTLLCPDCREPVGEDELQGTYDGLCLCCTDPTEPEADPVQDFKYLFGWEPDAD